MFRTKSKHIVNSMVNWRRWSQFSIPHKKKFVACRILFPFFFLLHSLRFLFLGFFFFFLCKKRTENKNKVTIKRNHKKLIMRKRSIFRGKCAKNKWTLHMHKTNSFGMKIFCHFLSKLCLILCVIHNTKWDSVCVSVIVSISYTCEGVCYRILMEFCINHILATWIALRFYYECVALGQRLDRQLKCQCSCTNVSQVYIYSSYVFWLICFLLRIFWFFMFCFSFVLFSVNSICVCLKELQLELYRFNCFIGNWIVRATNEEAQFRSKNGSISIIQQAIERCVNKMANLICN